MQALMLLMEIELTDFDKFMKEEMNITGDEINTFKESMVGLLETQITVSPPTVNMSMPEVAPPDWASIINQPMHQFQCNHTHDTFPTGPILSSSGPYFAPQVYSKMQMPKMPYDDPSPPTTPKIFKHPYHKMPLYPSPDSQEMEECIKSPLPPSPIIKHKLSKKLPKDWKKAVPTHDIPKKKHTLKKHVKHPKFIDDSEDTPSEEHLPTQATDGSELHVEI